MGVEASRPAAPRELNPGSVRIVTRDDTSATHIDIGSINSIADEEETSLEVSVLFATCLPKIMLFVTYSQTLYSGVLYK